MKKWTLVLMALPLLWACRKDDKIPFCEQYPDECVDIRMVKDWFYFDIGSRWVYEEENTGQRDTLIVTSSWSDTGSFEFTTRVFSSYDRYYCRCWANSAIRYGDDKLVKKSTRSTSVKRSKGKDGDYVGESRCFVFYPIQGYSKFNLNGGSPYSDNMLYIDSSFFQMTINETSFINVVKVREDHTYIEEDQPTVHYYASGVGLIRKELIDSNQVWNLIHYSVSQLNK
jgi:hypothetical protein